MKKHYSKITTFCLFLLIIWGCPSLKASDNISFQDSLQLVLDQTISDTAKLSVIFSNFHDNTINTFENIEYFKSIALHLSNKNADITSYIKTHNYVGAALYRISKYEEAYGYFKTALSRSEYPKNAVQMASTYYYMGYINRELGNYSLGIHYLNKAIPLYKELKMLDEVGSCFETLASIQRIKGNQDSTYLHLQSSLKFLYNSKDKNVLGDIHNQFGRYYRTVGIMDSAKVSFIKSLENYEQTNNLPSKSVVLNNLGNMAHIAGDYEEALDYYIKSKDLKEKIGYKKGISISYLNIGIIRNDLKDFNQAKIDFEKSLAIANEIEFHPIIILNHQRLGALDRDAGNVESAIEHHRQSLDIAQSINYSKGILESHLELGKDYAAKEEYEESMKYLMEGMDLTKAAKSKDKESAFLVEIVNVYLSYLKQNERNETSNVFASLNLNNQKIEALLIRAKELSNELDYAEHKINVYDGLHNFYKSANLYQKDAAILEEYLFLKDTLFANNRADAIAALETKFDTAEKEKEILKLEQEKEITAIKNRFTNQILFGLLFFSFLLSFIGWYTIKERSAKKEAVERELFRSKLSSDLHDDVGSILTGLAMQSELLGSFIDEKHQPTANNISNLSREAMGRMRDTVWAIDARKDKIEDLVDRMLDFSDNLLISKNISFEFQNNIQQKDQKIKPEIRQNIYLIFKEAITNIAKYSNGNSATTSLSIKDKNILLDIKDNGNIDASTIKTSGLGLSNMKMRTESIGGQFQIDTNNGFKIYCKIPL